MPAKSKAQFNYMQMMAHNPEKMHKKMNSKGPSPEVAKEFIRKTSAKKRKEFAKR